MKDTLISDFTNDEFQDAFKLYFKDLEIKVNDWSTLFREMTEEGGNFAYVRKDGKNEIIGFIMFRADQLSNWFFTENIGFIREFWISEKYRKNGHGSELLRLAEAFFSERGIKKIILTTDTAEQFYLSHGYIKDSSYSAKNGDDVFIKNIIFYEK